MKKLILSASLFLSAGALFSQTCDANDSTLMGSGSGNDVFYSLSKAKSTGNGTVKAESNTNWHLAFSVLSAQFPNNPAIGVAVRVNSPLGENPQLGTTGCVLTKIPGANFSNWHNLDTTGLTALPDWQDSDSTWNLSAFTKGYSFADPFNFIWGNYSQSNHKLSGSSVYVLYNASQNWYKKIFINELEFDSIWRFTISNIDNTDSNFVVINKKSYPNRNFVYYNVINNTVLDREPDNRTWDLLWTKYKSLVPLGPTKVPYTVTGVLQNINVSVAQNNGKKCNEVWLANKTAALSDMISTIGYDWKTFNGTGYTITDTFVYFVKSLDSNIYKMTLKSYAGGPLSKTVISFYEATLSINDNQLAGIEVYPNPVNSMLRIQDNFEVQSIALYDIFGKLVAGNEMSNILDVSELNTGMYILLVKTSEGSYQQRIIKE